MIISVAVVSGFKETIRDKMFVFWGQIEVTPYNPNPASIINPDPIEYNDTLIRQIQSVPGVKSVYSFAIKPAILHASSGTMEGLKLKGITSNYPLKSSEAIEFKGMSINFKDSGYSKDILLSQSTIDRLDAKIGDTLLTFFINPEQKFPSIRKLKIAGIYHTGMSNLDRSFALCDIRLLRRTSNWDHQAINGYQVFLKNYKDADKISREIYQAYLNPPLYPSPISDIYPNIYNWLGLINTNVFIILAIMAIVSVINLSTALLIFILERTNMTGILKSMGMPLKNIQNIFLYHAAAVALKGIIYGTVIGVGLCLLLKYFPFIHMNEEAYFMKTVPVHLVVWQVVIIDIGTLIFCVALMFIPALFVRKINIIKAIRFR